MWSYQVVHHGLWDYEANGDGLKNRPGFKGLPNVPALGTPGRISAASSSRQSPGELIALALP